MTRTDRLRIVHGCFIAFAVALILRAAHVQIWQGSIWAARAASQHFPTESIPAPRGEILDATGSKLVESRERLKLAVAPREVLPKERAKLRAELQRLGVPPATIRLALDKKKSWVEINAKAYLPAQVAKVLAIRGVKSTRVVDRVYYGSGAIRKLVGRLDPGGTAQDGIELALNSILTGQAGKDLKPRNRKGQGFETPAARDLAALPGNTVVLTINRELQEIVERELPDAVRRLEAVGGDVVILDPRTGEIAAMASYTAEGQQFSATGPLTVPYEPGSTVKPLLASRILGLGRAKPDDVVDTCNGSCEFEGRVIRDDHPAPRLALRDVIRISSNIGITRFAERLTPREQYEAYRDFGFGTFTGLELGTESPGTLRLPKDWSKVSRASLAMGYEMSVTSVQLATAYASIANGGELLEPTLIKEIRSPDGETVFRHERRVARRVMEPEIAAAMRSMLKAVVDSGTAVGTNFDPAMPLGGKTGTAWLNRGGRYASGEYIASFVGLFPIDDPAYVVLVKLVNPKGQYGGRTAAPVTKVMLQAAFAARKSSLDPKLLVSSSSSPPGSVPTPATTADEPVPAKMQRTVFQVAAAPPPKRKPVAPRPVPDVSHLSSVRSAVAELHKAGFNVVVSTGPRRETIPEAGALGRPGSTVQLFTPR